MKPANVVLCDVAEEIDRATILFPTWPTDPLHAVAVLGEEFGELQKAVLQGVYEPHKVSRADIRKEAVQTAAMAVRFLMSLGDYRFVRSEQHMQPVAEAWTRVGRQDAAKLEAAERERDYYDGRCDELRAALAKLIEAEHKGAGVEAAVVAAEKTLAGKS